MFSEYRGIPSQAKLLIYLSFIPNVAIGFIYTDLSYFLPNVQGIGSSWPGVAIAVMGLTTFALIIPFGVVADNYGRRKMLLLGNICASLSLIGFALTTNILLILLTAVLEGTGEAAYAVSVGAIIAEKAGDQKRTPAFSLLAFLGWIAAAFGGFIISSVDAFQTLGLSIREGHVLLYVIVGLLSLSITPFLLRIDESVPAIGRKGVLPRKSGRVLLRFGIYSVLIALGAGLFVPLMAYWYSLRYPGVTDVVSGQVLGLTSLSAGAVVFISPRLANKFGLVKATVATQAASTVFMLVVPSAPTFGAAAGIYFVRVFLMNLSNPLTQSMIMGLVSPDERGTASGITASLWRLPNSLSNGVGYSLMFAGELYEPFYIATVLYVVGITLYWFMFKDAKLPEEAGRHPQGVAQSSRLEDSDSVL